jgi:hypothetical protein
MRARLQRNGLRQPRWTRRVRTVFRHEDRRAQRHPTSASVVVYGERTLAPPRPLDLNERALASLSPRLGGPAAAVGTIAFIDLLPRSRDRVGNASVGATGAGLLRPPQEQASAGTGPDAKVQRDGDRDVGNAAREQPRAATTVGGLKKCLISR